jgi:hypothetical protein
MKYEIKRWDSGELIYEGEGESLRNVVEQAVSKKISLRNADLRNANLRNANLRNANLRNADLRNVNLPYADLRNVNLPYADLTYADLRNANLRGADLDFSSWPLWCGSTIVKLDRRQLVQLAYHAMYNMPPDILREFCADPIAFANSFHQIGEVPEIEKVKE